MSIDATAYTISIQKVKIEGEVCFEATIKELPDVTEWGETYNEAYELAIDTIETTADMFVEYGRDMPEPYKRQDDYSGRATLRLPKSLHKRVALLAEEEGVSLNSFVIAALGEKVGVESIASMCLKKFNDRLWDITAVSSNFILGLNEEISALNVVKASTLSSDNINVLQVVNRA